MESAMACNTPMSMHTKLSTKDCPNSETDMIYMSKVPYTSVVGTIMHTMVCMWPNLAEAVSVVSRFMSKPGNTRWKVVKGILLYLHVTRDKRIVFICVGRVYDLVSYCESNYASDEDRLKSPFVYVFSFGGTPIS